MSIIENIKKTITTQPQRIKQPNLKIGKGLKQTSLHFSKDIQLASKYMKRCSMSSVIREIYQNHKIPLYTH